MNEKGTNMKHDELMALADAYANSYMTFHEKATRAALSDALAKVVQDVEQREHPYRKNENDWQNRFGALNWKQNKP